MWSSWICGLMLATAPAPQSPGTCAPTPEALRALEALPAIADRGAPYERRIGPLRALAEKETTDLAIQRYYQDAIRRRFFIAESRRWSRVVEAAKIPKQ